MAFIDDKMEFDSVETVAGLNVTREQGDGDACCTMLEHKRKMEQRLLASTSITEKDRNGKKLSRETQPYQLNCLQSVQGRYEKAKSH